MDADKSAKNTPKVQKFTFPICLPNLSAQDQKFGILMKKGFIGRP